MMIKWLQWLVRQRKGAKAITEKDIRAHHTLYIDVWNRDFVSSNRAKIVRVINRLRRKRIDWNLAIELRAVGAKTKKHHTESNKPVAHSSLTVVEGFVKAQKIFNSASYCVYRVAGNTRPAEPLMGTNTIVVFERITSETLAKQSLQKGDIVLVRIENKRILHRIADLDVAGECLRIEGANPIPASAVDSRLVAVIYTQEAEESQGVALRTTDPHTLFDVWDESTFKPTRSDKPTPHSSETLSLRKTWRIRKAFKRPNYNLYYDFPNTNSMEPFIDTNTAVVFETITEQVLKKQPLQVGDVVIWRTADLGRTHRIIGMDEKGTSFYIKGDNSPYGDYVNDRWLIPAELITERAVAVIYARQLQEDD